MTNMSFFDNFASNTCAGSGNQLFFGTDGVRTGRVFYKISAGGAYNYSILFSNIIDSTYADGSVSHKNLICEPWDLCGARVGRCSFVPDKPLSQIDMSELCPSDFKALTFDGKSSKTVAPGEFFSSDPQAFSFKKDEYLVLELSFCGSMIPYHEESLLPVFVRDGDSWRYSKHMPFAGMIGCDRPVSKRIAYIGDSITQGIGTAPNSYRHWNAELSKKLGDGFAFWNLGLGYGRASDAASDGAWLYKAKHNDVIFVCYGVNDILHVGNESQLKKDLSDIVTTLKKSGKTVILQTVPPFDYKGDKIGMWERVNEFIKTELRPRVDLLFDNVPVLGRADAPHMSRFGGHPNEEGCAVWAEALFEKTKNFF